MKGRFHNPQMAGRAACIFPKIIRPLTIVLLEARRFRATLLNVLYERGITLPEDSTKSQILQVLNTTAREAGDLPVLHHVIFGLADKM